MRILVTGCYGFIGFNFIRYVKSFHKNDFEIFGIDNLNNPYSKLNYQNFPLKNFYSTNINSINKVDIKKVDCIVNFAAESHVDNSINNPNLFIKSNVLGVSNLIRFAMDKKINNFLHISTDEVYGSLTKGFATEKSSLNPSSPYSASKAGAEFIARSFSKTFDFPIKFARPANNYGPYQQPEKFIPYSIINLIKNKNIELYGNGRNIRHWLNVKDTSSAILKILIDGENNEFYNIGSGDYLTNLQVAKKVTKVMNLDNSKIEFVKDRPGHDFRYAINFDKLKSLGWKNNCNFEEELERTIAWYQNNSQWWEKGIKTIYAKRKRRFNLN